MLEQLLEITRTGEFEDNGNLAVMSTSWRGDALELTFRVDHGDETTSLWTVECSGVVEHLLTDSRYQVGLNVWSSEHPLLDQHVQPHHGLYVSKVPSDPDRVVGQLWQAHLQAVDDWIPFDRYLNGELPLRTLLASGNALVATGPAFLIAAYSIVLEAAGCGPSQLSARKPRASSVQLIHFGESYVVAERISATKAAV